MSKQSVSYRICIREGITYLVFPNGWAAGIFLYDIHSRDGEIYSLVCFDGEEYNALMKL